MPSERISCTARPTSFTIMAVVKPKSKLRGSTARGNLSRLAVFRPDPELITSIITLGSRPALTPIATASEVATIAVADRKLLASFMVWPAPGLVEMKNGLPIASIAGFIAS